MILKDFERARKGGLRLKHLRRGEEFSVTVQPDGRIKNDETGSFYGSLIVTNFLSYWEIDDSKTFNQMRTNANFLKSELSAMLRNDKRVSKENMIARMNLQLSIKHLNESIKYLKFIK